tara:strand:- start:16679 stop:18037 length:1359 start_codon:yes stop_codon:yes gene_type:complete
MKALKIAFQDINSVMRFDGSYHLSEGTLYLKKLRKMPHEDLDNLTSEIFTAGRSKRIYTDEKYGYPYLSNSDVVRQNPIGSCNYNSKKYGYDEPSFLKEGMIVTGRVGAIGQTAYITSEFEEFEAMGSDNIIRIVPKDKNKSGYIYSFLTSKFGNTLFWRLAAGGVQPYISEDMLRDIPIPILSEFKQQQIHNLIKEASILRVEANRLLQEGVAYFEELIGSTKVNLGFQTGKLNSKSLNTFHKRLDGQFQLLWKDLKKEKKEGVNYFEIWSYAKSIFVGGRGKRLYTEKGVPFLSSSNMMLFNPKRDCKKVSKNTPGLQTMMVSKYDILISRSGTVGNTILVGDDLADTAISEHALRLVIDSKKISPKYVFCFLKTKYGMKCMEASSFGSVIITLNEDLIGNIELPVLENNHQKIINDKVELYLQKMDEATLKENQAINQIENEIETWQTS